MIIAIQIKAPFIKGSMSGTTKWSNLPDDFLKRHRDIIVSVDLDGRKKQNILNPRAAFR